MPGSMTSRTTTEGWLFNAFSRPLGPSWAESSVSCSLCRYSSSNLLSSVSSSTSSTDVMAFNNKPRFYPQRVKKCEGKPALQINNSLLVACGFRVNTNRQTSDPGSPETAGVRDAKAAVLNFKRSSAMYKKFFIVTALVLGLAAG